MVRSGDEPVNARSPLRLRLVLAAGGAVTSGAGAVAWGAAGIGVLAAVFGAAALLALVDAAVVLRRIRQGPHYQPGPDVPPYRPVAPSPGGPSRPSRGRPSAASRQRRYFVLMGVCLTLIVAAWVWVRTFSVGIAAGMTVIAMVIPPVASVVANAGWDGTPDPPGGSDGGSASGSSSE